MPDLKKEIRIYVQVRRTGGKFYDSDKYTSEEMTEEEMVEAFRLFVREHHERNDGRVR